MLRRIVGWVVLVPLSVVLIVFALANRQLTVVNFNPFVPAETLGAPDVGVPLFLVLVAVARGGVATWLAQGAIRRERRQLRRQMERLGRELDVVRRTTPGRRN